MLMLLPGWQYTIDLQNQAKNTGIRAVKWWEALGMVNNTNGDAIIIYSII